jgi:hypothetical protein
MDAAVASRAARWARFAGRLVSWSSNTTTTRSRWPDERALIWLGLNLGKLGLATLARAVEATLARAVEPAAQPGPVIAVTPSAAAPTNEAVLRGVKDIFPPPFRPYLGFSGGNRAILSGLAPVPPLHQGRTANQAGSRHIRRMLSGRRTENRPEGEACARICRTSLS